MLKTTRIILGTVLIAALTQSSTKAVTVAFDFIQEGYAEDAVITGTFEGEDLNGDGILAAFDELPIVNEISFFSFEFTGNSLVPAYSVTILDSDPTFIFSLRYELGTGSIGGDLAGGLPEKIVVDGGNNFYSTVGPDGAPGGLIFDNGSLTEDATDEPVIVRQKGQRVTVPENGATVLLLSIGLFSLSMTRGRP